jgi:hypothetical protein
MLNPVSLPINPPTTKNILEIDSLNGILEYVIYSGHATATIVNKQSESECFYMTVGDSKGNISSNIIFRIEKNPQRAILIVKEGKALPLEKGIVLEVEKARKLWSILISLGAEEYIG